HGVRVPDVAIQDALDPTRMGVAGLLGQLPAVLAFHLGQQAAQVIGPMLLGFWTVKVRLQHTRGLVNEFRGVVDDLSLIPAHTFGCNHESYPLIAVYPRRGTVILVFGAKEKGHPEGVRWNC